MLKKRILPAFLMLLMSLPTSVFAQSGSENLEYRKWRLTIIPPLSTNGVLAPSYTAKYSINVLGGYHGGLNGGEVGLLFNATKYYSSGFQLAGGINYTKGYMEGFNIAGISNISRQDMSGIQLAGAANISGDDLEGIQGTFGLNISKGSTSGLQFAGIGNASNSYLEGLQVAGIFNATARDISGLQAAGFVNIAKDNVEGLQASGILNFAGDDISGMQVTGGANIAIGDLEGLLVSGAFNYSKGSASGLLASGGINVATDIEGLAFAGIGNVANTLTGMQVGGFNFSEEATGLQIGILNIAKEFEGAPIGVLSLYGNGRKNLDVRFSDAGFTDFSITTGTHRVYNMAMFGINSALDRDVYRIGFAVGLEKNIQDSFENVESTTLFVNQEFSMHHLFEGDWDRTLNYIYSYKYLIGNRFNNGLSLYGGPSVNMQVTRVSNSNDYTWYSLWSPERKGREYRFWVGFTVGMRVFKQKNLPLMQDEFNDWGFDVDF